MHASLARSVPLRRVPLRPTPTAVYTRPHRRHRVPTPLAVIAERNSVNQLVSHSEGCPIARSLVRQSPPARSTSLNRIDRVPTNNGGLFIGHRSFHVQTYKLRDITVGCGSDLAPVRRANKMANMVEKQQRIQLPLWIHFNVSFHHFEKKHRERESILIYIFRATNFTNNKLLFVYTFTPLIYPMISFRQHLRATDWTNEKSLFLNTYKFKLQFHFIYYSRIAHSCYLGEIDTLCVNGVRCSMSITTAMTFFFLNFLKYVIFWNTAICNRHHAHLITNMSE